MARTTTARSGERPGFLAVLIREIPTGLLVNVGAGQTGPVAEGVAVVNVDHAIVPNNSEMFVVADAGRLPFKAGVFDAGLAKDILEHVDDPVRTLQEIRRVVKLDAPLIATVPRAVPRAVWDDPTHVRGFTARAVRTALELSGWRVARLRRIGGFPGASRLGLTPHLESLMAIPVFGHRFGVNWIIRASAESSGDSTRPQRSIG